MSIISQLEHFNKNLAINKSKTTKLHDVLNELEIFNDLCYPKFPHKTEEENKPLSMNNNKFEWNYCKYFYVEIMMDIQIQNKNGKQ